MKRILILACSATKFHTPGDIPAWHRYDGPAWRTLRANTPAPFRFEAFALSAEHGLISAHKGIADYDRRMTPARSRELVDQVAAELRSIDAGEIFACGGGAYRDLLETARVIAELETKRPIPIGYSSGGIGEQLGQLKAWLRREAQ